jgi:hypothetical protein
MPPIPSIPHENLLGAWSHSHEEDHDGLRVFRHAGYPFPPSRGRLGFELLPDGAARYSGLTQDDRPGLATCRWTLDPKRPEDLTIVNGEQCLLRASIASAGSDRLELKLQ